MVKKAKKEEITKDGKAVLAELGVDFESIEDRVKALGSPNEGQMRQIVSDAVRNAKSGGCFSEARLIDWLMDKLHSEA